MNSNPVAEALEATRDYLVDLKGEAGGDIITRALQKSGVAPMRTPTLDQLDLVSDELIQEPGMEETLAGRFLKVKVNGLRITREL